MHSNRLLVGSTATLIACYFAYWWNDIGSRVKVELYVDADRNESTYEIDQSCLTLLQCGEIFQKFRWKPCGCSMHWYSSEDVVTCIKRRKEKQAGNLFAFIGDSRMRYLGQTFMDVSGFRLTGDIMKVRNGAFVSYPHRNLTTSEAEARYVGDVFLEQATGMPECLADLKPALVVSGVGLWFLAEGALQRDVIIWNMTLARKLRIYRGQVRKWARNATALVSKVPTAKVVWQVQEPVAEQGSVYYNITNRKIDQFNEAAIQVLQSFPRVLIWHSARQFHLAYKAAGYQPQHHPDPVHMSYFVMEIQSQMLLNLVCNEYMVNVPETVCCRNLDVGDE